MRKIIIDLLCALYMPMVLVSLCGLGYQAYAMFDVFGWVSGLIWLVAGFCSFLIVFGIVGLLIEIEYKARLHLTILKKELAVLKN